MALNQNCPFFTEGTPLRDIAQYLYNQAQGPRGGKFYPAAKALGDPTWRAQLKRFLEEPDFKPSQDFTDALYRWAGLTPVVEIHICHCGQVHHRECRLGRQLRHSADPDFLRAIKHVAVPFLHGRQNGRRGE